MQFLGELTAYAAGKMDFKKYKRLTEDRIKKGKAWAEKGKNGSYLPSLHASFPPKFPIDAWNYLNKINKEVTDTIH